MNITMIGFDLETTGVDPWTDRIVAAARIIRSWAQINVQAVDLVRQTEPIPAEATAVHGIATWVANLYGRVALACAEDHSQTIRSVLGDGGVLVGMNLAFDLTILNRYVPLATLELGWERVWDVMLLDRIIDPLRKGPRKLTDLARHYGVELADAHNPLADIRACLDIADVMGKSHDLSELAVAQPDTYTNWRTTHARTFTHLSGQRRRYDTCWPYCANAGPCQVYEPTTRTSPPVVATGWDVL